VVADFRSRDVAAGGKARRWCPPSTALFGAADETRVVCNIGGISNISVLPAGTGRPVTGFDCGPGNALLDDWIQRHRGTPYDDGGRGRRPASSTQPAGQMLAEPYFRAPPPKSTGRDLFHPGWLQSLLDAYGNAQPQPVDVQATLATLTATAIAQDVQRYAPEARRLIVCGGGAHNDFVMATMANQLPGVLVQTTGDFGVPVSQVEAIAFAWLARQCTRAPGNVATVTGAAGPRVLGAIYPR
jgi:anhydro-N-acetylmuramic acid kinase